MSGGQTQISEALRLARAGNFAAAERLCRDLIRREPANAGAIMLAGLIAASRGENDKAVDLFERAIALQPQRSDAHFNLGLIRVRQGRDADAVVSFERALKIDPSNLEAAVARAEALLVLQRWAEAIHALDLILAARPNLTDLWLKRGAAYDTLADYAKALESYRRAEVLVPADPVTKELIGTILVRFARFREAIATLTQALALGHQTADTYLQRALAYSSLGERDKALADFARAHEIAPMHRRVLIYYAECLHRAGRSADAEAVLEAAREHDPVGSRVLLGNIRSDRRRDEEALAAFAEAEAAGTGEFIIAWARTLHNLRLGNFAEGLRDFDERLRGPLGETGKALPGVEWQPGSGQRDRTLLLYAEQGFGDTINFARYVPQLIDQGHDVVLQVQPPLVALCRSLHPKVAVISRADPIPPFDARAPIPSLPARLGTRLDTIPAQMPYLQPTPAAREAWQARTAGLIRPRIGLCWSGSSTHERDAVRSVPFAAIRRLLEAAGPTFVSLQRDPRPDEKAEIAAEKRLVDFTAQLIDFNETAALIDTLDLVVTVDTSVAHVAGALGKPVWILLAYAPDWRWLWDRDDTPWYPSARLFRQTVYGDWSDVLEHVANELAELAR
jgi:tetratricopeptide (TPR) repeat protein